MRTTLAYVSVGVLLAILAVGVFPGICVAQSLAATPQKPTVFQIKYISDGTVYINAGHNADISEGMKLSVIEPPPDGVSDGVRFRGYPHVAELNVVSVADTSSVCDIVSTSSELKLGDLAFLSPQSVETRHLAENAAESDNYPIVVGFTSGDPIDQEFRATKIENIHESPMGVMRGRFGFSYGGISESGMSSAQLGMMLDADITHIGGTWWNFGGYWRGNMTLNSTNLPGAGTQTLTDLINRTYHIGFTYQNPYSPTTIGIGRLYLPWAPSLSTIDGGYLGRKVGRFATVGAFAGSTPDPTSWSYNPNQRIAGAFVNFEGGNYDGFHFMTTEGLAVNSIGWRVSRQFIFTENNLSWKRKIAFYNSLQADAARTSPLPNGGSNPTGITRSFTSIHFQPINLIGFGFNHNYFRSLPTFDPRLIGTGALDQYLFQGFSGDVRLSLPYRITLYTSLGKSKTTTDTKSSLNQAYGIGFNNIFRTGFLLDLHYTKFTSDFGSGQYESVSIGRNITDTLRISIYGGDQRYNSPNSSNTNAKFVNGVVDWSFSRRYFLEGTYGWYQGTSLNYNQWSTLIGYRFGGLRR